MQQLMLILVCWFHLFKIKKWSVMLSWWPAYKRVQEEPSCWIIDVLPRLRMIYMLSSLIISHLLKPLESMQADFVTGLQKPFWWACKWWFYQRQYKLHVYSDPCSTVCLCRRWRRNSQVYPSAPCAEQLCRVCTRFSESDYRTEHTQQLFFARAVPHLAKNHMKAHSHLHT